MSSGGIIAKNQRRKNSVQRRKTAISGAAQKKTAENSQTTNCLKETSLAMPQQTGKTAIGALAAQTIGKETT